MDQKDYTQVKVKKTTREKLLPLKFHPEIRFDHKQTYMYDVIETLVEFWNNAHKEEK